MAIIPGGIAEMFIISEDDENIYLKARKGFVKAAIQEVLIGRMALAPMC